MKELEDDNTYEWEMQKNSETLKVYTKFGSIFNDNLPVCKCIFDLQMDIANLNLVDKVMSDPNIRAKWDKNILEYKIIEG